MSDNDTPKSIPQRLNDIASEIKTLQISETIYQSKLYEAYKVLTESLNVFVTSDFASENPELVERINEGIAKTYDYRNHVNELEHADTSSYSVVIFIRNLFSVGAVRIEDANVLKDVLSVALRCDRKVLLSAKGVSMHSKLFWAVSIGYLYGEVPVAKIESLLTIEGINQNVATWLKDIMARAKEQVNDEEIQQEISGNLIDIPEA